MNGRNSNKKKRIAVLFHEKQRPRTLRRYLITHLANFWKRDGIEVFFLFGVEKFLPADLLIVHVDLSVVPDSYVEFAQRYPVAVNARVTDIRKRIVSKNLVTPHDSYSGRVIVKSDLNYAGLAEQRLGPVWQRCCRRTIRAFRAFLVEPSAHIDRPTDYRIYEDLRQVPPACFDAEELVVEKFLPERVKGRYAIRIYHFLGDRDAAFRLESKHPIVKDTTCIRRERIEPNPEVKNIRRSLKFDYGKFDYVVREGRAVLLDANKTTGIARFATAQQNNALRSHLAEGIYSYLK